MSLNDEQNTEADIRVDAYERIRNGLGRLVDTLDKMYQKDQMIWGIPTGLEDLDSMLHGLRRGEVMIVSGHNSSGRLDFLLNILQYVSLKEKLPVLFTGIAQIPDMILVKLLSSLARVDPNKIYSGFLEDDDWPRLTTAVSLTVDSPFYYYLPSRFSVSDLANYLRNLKEKEPELAVCGLYRLNYLSPKSADEYTPETYARMMRELKALASELDIVIIGVADFPTPRYIDRPNKRAVLSDFRPYTSLVDFADRVLLLYRDEVFDEDSPDKESAEIITAKNVFGPIGMLRVTYLEQHCRFENFYVQDNN